MTAGDQRNPAPPAAQAWRGVPALSLLNGKLEDRFTEYLYQLLTSPPVLRGFVAELCGQPLSLADAMLTRVTKRMVVPGGFPDLVIEPPNRRLVIEVKVDSPLNSWQIGTYARSVANWTADDSRRSGHLFLLTLARDRAVAMAEAQSQVRECRCDIPVVGLTWEAVAELFRSLPEPFRSMNCRLAAHLEDLASLITAYIGKPTLPLTPEEVMTLADPNTANAVYYAWKLLPKIAGALQGYTDLNVRPRSGGIDPAGDMRKSWVGLQVNGRFWVLFWFAAWAEVGESPLFLQISSSADFPRAQKLPSVRIFRHPADGGERYVIPLPLRQDLDADAMARELAELIYQSIGAIAAEGPELPEGG